MGWTYTQLWRRPHLGSNFDSSSWFNLKLVVKPEMASVSISGEWGSFRVVVLVPEQDPIWGGHVAAGAMPSSTWSQKEIVSTAPSLYPIQGNNGSDIASLVLWVESCPQQAKFKSSSLYLQIFGNRVIAVVTKLKILRWDRPGFRVGPKSRDWCP